MILRVKVIKAILTHDTQIGSNMDPFVLLKLGNQVQQGKTFDQQGDMPQFNQQFDFQITDQSKVLHLIVYDQDTTVDDLIGEVQIKLEPILLQPFTQRKWYSLKYNGKKPAGKIMLEFQITVNGVRRAPTQHQRKQILKPHIHSIGTYQKPQHALNDHHIHIRNSSNIHRYHPTTIQHLHSQAKPIIPSSYRSPHFKHVHTNNLNQINGINYGHSSQYYRKNKISNHSRSDLKNNHINQQQSSSDQDESIFNCSRWCRRK